MVLSSPGGVSRPRSGRRQRRPRCCPRVAWVSLSVAVAAAVATLKSSALFSVASCVDGSIPARNLSAAALLGRNEEAPSSQLGTASRLSPARIFAACASIGGNPLMVSEKPGPWGVSRPRDPRRRHLHSYFSFPATSASPVAPGCGCVLPVPSSTQTALLLTAPPATRRRLQSRTRAGGQTKTPLRLVLATPTAVKAASLPSGLTSKAQAVSAAVQPALQAAGAQRGGPAVTLSPISRTKSVAAAVRVPRDTLPTSSIAAILQKFPVSETAWRASYMPHVLPVASRAARPWLSCFASTFAFWSGGEASIEFSRKKSRLVTSSHVPTSLHLGSTLRRSWWSGACSSGSPAAASTIPSTLFPCGTVSPVHRALAGLSAAAAARAARTSLRSLGLVFTPEFTSVCGASPTAAATAGSSVAAVFPSAQCLVSATLTSVVSVQGVIAGAAGGLLPQPTFYEDHFRRRQQQQRLRFVFASNLATMRQADDITELQKEQARDKCCTTVRTVGADWRMPSKDGKLITGLIVNNSVAGGKVEFVPQEGNRVCWYACGPTVYDASHMGHARTYVTFDCIRRIMSDYFNYDVFLCMNITDIDDKIIKRSQEQGVNFMEVARHWEKEFFADLATLNVRLPTVVTRVSEHIPEVLALVGRILKNGYAYESQGSVYFDTQAFGGSHKHVYGRMEPSSVADEERALKGEGELGVTSSEKRHPCDFALWKKAKEGEPSWNSPWGKGRPGWHIECSAMADSVFPFPLDIHSGGIDLRFPHHDNELAQSEAANDRPHWVNYFLHSGHLHIQGAKMSKSLKNFITIKECLTRFSPRHIRLLCLMNRWDSLMNYNPDGDTMQQAVDVDRGFVDFFALVRAKLRDAMPISAHEQKWGPSEVALSDELHSAKEQVHRCLQDNFNTPGALVALQRLVSSANTYLNRHTGGCVRAPLVRAVAQYVFRMLRGAAASAEGDMEESLLECIGSFREQVRAFAANTLRSLQLQQRKSNAADQAPSEGPASANARNDAAGRGSEGQPGEAAFPNGALRSAVSPQNVKDLLRACDELRDQRLRALGILLQDRPDGTFVIKRVSKEELDRETEFKAEEGEKAFGAEERASAERGEQRRPHDNQRVGDASSEQTGTRAPPQKAELQEKKKVERQTAPQDYYRVLYGDQYATYDAEGVPLTLKSGDPVSKSQRQKMQKFLQKHAKLYNEAQEADSDVKRSDELSPE